MLGLRDNNFVVNSVGGTSGEIIESHNQVIGRNIANRVRKEVNSVVVVPSKNESTTRF